MNKILITLMLLVSVMFTNAQSKGVHFTQVEKTTKVFQWKNGYDKNVDVIFQNVTDDDLDITIIRKALMSVMVKAKFTLKNRLSFVPVKLSMISNTEDSNHTAIVKYRGKNAYGTESSSTAYYTFTKEGKVTKM